MGSPAIKKRRYKPPVVDPLPRVPPPFADIARLGNVNGSLPRRVIVRVKMPGSDLRIEEELVTRRHVYFVNEQEVSVNEYLAVTRAFCGREL